MFSEVNNRIPQIIFALLGMYKYNKLHVDYDDVNHDWCVYFLYLIIIMNQ